VKKARRTRNAVDVRTIRPETLGGLRPRDDGGTPPLYRQGDTIPLGTGQTLRVLGVRDDDADKPPVLVVEDLPGAATSAAS
jgi:hypothetical protein